MILLRMGKLREMQEIRDMLQNQWDPGAEINALIAYLPRPQLERSLRYGFP